MPLLQGKIFYAKVLGKPAPAYDKTKNEWAFDLCLDDKGMAEAKRLGYTEKVKNRGDERGNYLTFRRSEFKFGTAEPVANQPFNVVDHHGKPWDVKKLIGNGSTVNVKYNVFPGRKGSKPIALAIQVWDYVEYTSTGGFPVRKDTPAATDDFTASEENE